MESRHLRATLYADGNSDTHEYAHVYAYAAVRSVLEYGLQSEPEFNA